MNRIIITLLILFTCNSVDAKTKVISHFNFGKVGNITYAAAPKEIQDTTITDQYESSEIYTLDKNCNVILPVKVKAQSISWSVIK